MKNNMMFGLLCLAMIASVSFAQPEDYNMYVKTGGCLRYIGPEVSYPILVFPQAHPDEYREVEFNQIQYMNSESRICPLVNGEPVCA